MALGHFQNLNNLYRYTLVCPSPTATAPSLALARGELISSVHKLIRRARIAELCFLVRAFFSAVQAAIDTSSQEGVNLSLPTLKGSISNFMNRIALSLIEEGVMVHCTDDVQKLACDSLGKAGRCHSNETRHDTYATVSRHIQDALIATRDVPRGRLGSVVMSYSAHGRPEPDDPKEKCLLAKLHPDHVRQNAGPATFAAHVMKTMPSLYPVAQQAPYKDCAEFRRQCVMNAPIVPFVGDEHKTLVDSGPLGDPVPPTRKLLHEIGALEDVHTKGKRNRAAWAEFLDKGMKVENATSVRLFGRSYSELEALYNEGKNIELDEGKWDCKKADTPKKKQKTGAAPKAVPKPGGRLYKSIEGPRFASEDALVDLTPESKLLGFKNGTVVGSLRCALGPFAAGDRVFFKMGESYDDCMFAAECAKWQEAAGLAFVPTQVVWVKPVLGWWSRIPVDSTNKGDWSAALQKSLRARVAREQDFFGYVPCLVASRFDGMRVSEVHACDADTNGLSLLKNLLFAKYVGIKDVGPFNMLLSEEQEVLVIDVGKPSASQIEAYNAKGLFTSHRFGSCWTTAVSAAATRNRTKVAEFVTKLRTQPEIPTCASVGDTAFWDRVDAFLRGDELAVH